MGSGDFRTFLLYPFKEEFVKYFELPEGSCTFEGNAYSFNGVFVAPMPRNLDEFISDMLRIGIDLRWKPEITELFEPQKVVAENTIEDYYRELLTKMGKEHELNMEDDNNGNAE